MMNPSEINTSEPLFIKIIRLLRWDKPAGRLILMIPALWAVCLASNGHPPALLIGIIILGTLATSGAGCVVNDLWDRDIDPLVERTKKRPLADRSLTVKTGIIVGLIAFLCAGLLTIYLTPLSFWLSVAAVPVIIAYPLAKRVFPIPQLVLSIAWGFAVLISWSAVTGNLQSATWLLWGATVVWTLGFDTVYAMSDRPDDLKVGVKSSAIFFGDYAAEAVGVFFLGTTILLGLLGKNLGLSLGFWLSLAIALILWGKEYYQLKFQESEKPYGQIFRENVTIGFILLVGMILGIL